ncbi:putative calpain-like cysteine peptidase [Trypanosoma rangeli]|uniref:Putative calpain-like cysteine peptidase n=1 Tax=Trypanosoma rangeli TaxID=5698 RepID=A0A422P034_TRYRA|nr:putative calpain-like cysteine peptidase [Trypanosoma rangeli]RNF11049.1 putative calpain-like cysteine peptidase [Trypanosoma rangeli]|eukprot:RNF11049.1 putative calpain-like cysteine peptidase [Trypanosoma rangeli]
MYPTSKMMGVAAAKKKKRVSGPSHTTLANGNHARANRPKRAMSCERLSQLVQLVSGTKVLHLICGHVYRNYSDPQCDAFLGLCDTLLQEIAETARERGVLRAPARDGAASEDDEEEDGGQSTKRC